MDEVILSWIMRSMTHQYICNDQDPKMAGGLASGRGYSPMLPMTLGGEDLRTMSWMKLNDLYKAEEEEAWINGFSKMVNAMYAKDTGNMLSVITRYECQ